MAAVVLIDQKYFRTILFDTDADKFAALGERTDEFEYACEQFGQPLYVFIYHFNEGKEYDIFPSGSAPYKHCTVK